MRHTHQTTFLPRSGEGWAVCECGATLRYENGKPFGSWHECALCVSNRSTLESAERAWARGDV